jgi:hypothetical protein
MTGCSMMTKTNNFGAIWPKRLNGHFLLQGAELFREDAFFVHMCMFPLLHAFS